VKLRNRYDISAWSGEVENSKVQCRLSAADTECFDPAFQRCDAPLKHIIGRVTYATVPITFSFEIKERRSVLGAVERVCDGLIDRDGHGLAGRLDFVSAMDCNGL